MDRQHDMEVFYNDRAKSDAGNVERKQNEYQPNFKRIQMPKSLSQDGNSTANATLLA